VWGPIYTKKYFLSDIYTYSSCDSTGNPERHFSAPPGAEKGGEGGVPALPGRVAAAGVHRFRHLHHLFPGHLKNLSEVSEGH
jgi:hypothetical protein